VIFMIEYKELKKKCKLCNQIKENKSFNRANDNVCNSCYYIISKAIKVNLLQIRASRKGMTFESVFLIIFCFLIAIVILNLLLVGVIRLPF